MPLLYILTFIGMMALESLYIPIARRLHIGQRPGARSFTPAGGGIIFAAAAAVFAAVEPAAAAQPFFSTLLLGALLLVCISFADDIYGMPPAARLAVQLCVTGTLFGSILRPDMIDIYIILLVGGVWLTNAFNFLDGINGMLSLYSAVVIGSIIALLATAGPAALPFGGFLAGFSAEACIRLLGLVLTAIVAFLFFNLRGKALVFSGDTGSIFLGFIISVVLLSICLGLNSAAPLVFVAVFAVDSGLTIAKRLFKGEKIMQAHRKHLYQHFVHTLGASQLSVTMAYAAIQATINALYFVVPQAQQLLYALLVYLILSTSYFRLTSYKKILKPHISNE